MITGIDHIVILVDDLDEAIRQYSDLGFAVSAGGKHPRYTHNALFAIGDGSYVELISFYELDGADAHRWFKYRQHGGGLIDYAVGSDDLDADMARATASGVVYTGPNAGARARPDGVEIAWKTATPSPNNPATMPFLIEDISDRRLRVPEDPNPNGVTGIAKLVIAVNDLEAAVASRAALLGFRPVPIDDVPEGRTGVAYSVGPHRVELHTASGDEALAARLAGQGEGPYELVFTGASNHTFDPAAAGNARMTVQAG